MLDKNALQQLSQLKTQIVESKDQGDGEVRGSQRRFGFVRLDDGRDVFLAPDDMQRVFPGDRVRINVLTDDKGKFKAELEKLLDSPLDCFTGRYVVRGQGHFIEPDLPRFNKLLFIPPSQRKKCSEGDFLYCQVAQHPFKDGKSQVKVLENIGSPDNPGIEGKYTQRKFKLPKDWPKDSSIGDDLNAANRSDLRDIPFVTIDSAETRDIDDALWAQANDSGWTLYIAVADPGAFIAPGSPLDRAALQRANTVYLPGFTQTMLPNPVSQGSCSLVANEDRAAIVCRVQVGKDGAISDIQFSEAMIQSRAKLSYHDVNADLHGDMDLGQTCLKDLYAASLALRQYRSEHHIVMPEQADFHFQLNEQRRIESITKIERNDAHRLVEECMLAANRSAALWLADSPALYVSHAGLREDRYDNVRAVIAKEIPNLADCQFESLSGYKTLIQACEHSESALPLRSIFARMLQPGELSVEAKPHFGLGLECYTTFTSPLRKYSDLLVQRCIRAKLNNTTPTLPNEAELAALQDAIRNGRQASKQMEQWLQYQYLARNTTDTVYEARIAHVNGGGFTVELLDTGISGFVEARTIPEKLSFDADTLRLFNDKQSFQLEQLVRVKTSELDDFQRKLMFLLVA
ncbi:VacB/RNase II family 3'-5' exoribonuclease [uncultured Zhongshania sp.]|uniref:VacB/RNase II family 3'-5' exoribonuclease n=1 Tax=uncultured Zhongshania sp. TaxID=1642288 RepID=UPI0030DD5CD1|tara:strand:+ start:2532 stop:4424 length:1893 start_codon:yes stop_codon:yes gene_type:complete